MQISYFEQDGMAYSFEPPIEVGDRDAKSIHHLAAFALLGPEIDNATLRNAMQQFADILQTPTERTEAFNQFLTGKHTVTGERLPGGMPTWRSDPPREESTPGATLNPESSRLLQEELRDIDEARMAVRSMDVIVYPS